MVITILSFLDKSFFKCFVACFLRIAEAAEFVETSLDPEPVSSSHSSLSSFVVVVVVVVIVSSSSFSLISDDDGAVSTTRLPIFVSTEPRPRDTVVVADGFFAALDVVVDVDVFFDVVGDCLVATCPFFPEALVR